MADEKFTGKGDDDDMQVRNHFILRLGPGVEPLFVQYRVDIGKGREYRTPFRLKNAVDTALVVEQCGYVVDMGAEPAFPKRGIKPAKLTEQRHNLYIYASDADKAEELVQRTLCSSEHCVGNVVVQQVRQKLVSTYPSRRDPNQLDGASRIPRAARVRF